ncbi:MAG: toll/interleukin-1 receptor domain-containing protein [Allosphingosinicella sp.]
MGTGDEAGAARYTAFISYSHKDAAVGRWLHRRLEGYRLPRRLAGSEGEHGPVPARLTPIFRDREELPAAGDLSERVRAALAASEHLVVICSPSAAASPWVAKEIATFRALHPDRPILAAIVDGEPGSCFPDALSAGGRVEPLAADLRPGRDGKRLGLLKLVAGLAGVGLDALVQRDAQRRVRRVTYVTGMALAAVLAMAMLTAFAFGQRREAERQRVEAEGLVEFMLTDLRDKLKSVGRLPIMRAVNERALDHYRKQDLSRLSPDALERRARTLLVMGEDDEKLGNSPAAAGEFAEAARTTGAILAASPGDPERLYNHAQSEYWIGFLAYGRSDWPTARRHWEAYKSLAGRLIQAKPGDPRSFRELGYSEGNLCTLQLDGQPAPAAALPSCLASLAAMERVRRMLPQDPKAVEDVANRHAWVGKAWLARADLPRAKASFETYLGLLEGLARASPDDLDIQDQQMRALMTMAEFHRDHGRRTDAALYAKRAATLAAHLTAADPTNRRWRQWQARISKLDAN